MKQVYLIVGEDGFLIKKEIEKIINSSSSLELVTYDLKEAEIKKAIEDLDTMNFFVTGKIVVLQNAYFLTSEKPRNVIEQDTRVLEKYLGNPNPENILVIVTSKLDERKSITKLVKKHSKVIELETNYDIGKLIRDNLEDFEMDNNTQKYLMEQVLNHPERCYRELEKLKLYCYDKKKITKEDIDKLVMPSIDDNIFKLIDAIVKKEKRKAFKTYEDMILHNEEPAKILVLLANRFRLYYQVKVLSKRIYRDEEIGRIIGSHPYPVKLAREVVYDYSEKELLSYLKKLAEIDLSIKTGKTYQNIALETFILSL